MKLSIGKTVEIEIQLWSLYVRMGRQTLYLCRGFSAINNTPL
ncbi:hypothetical protein [Polynucleobacter sp. MG-Unter2-18]|nr:hypothetical protein [Polynucleobacter sp. MG-Unter2-18]